MIKTIYAQPRKEGLSREEFVHMWRGHGALAMTLPGFWDPVVRYMQSDRLHDISAFPSASEAYVGVGEIYYEDIAGRRASKQSTELQAVLHPDASRMFDRQGSINLGVQEFLLFRGRYAPFKIYAFISRVKSSSRADFLSEWEELQAKTLREAEWAYLARRAVSGRSLEEDSQVDGTLEFSFDSIAEAVTFYAGWMGRVKAEPVGSRLDRLIVVPAFVSLFYDRRYYRD